MRARALTALLVAALETTVLAAAPITNGSADNVDPAVVAVLVGQSVHCTGTLIAPRVVLTAAHCGIRPDNYWDFGVYFGSDITAAGTTIDLVDAYVDSDADLALLFLARPAPVVPIALLTQPMDASFVGASARVVGFGVTGAVAADAGIKREGNASVASVGASLFTMTPAPSQPCTMDSGGPTLVVVGSTEYVAGVISGGDGACTDHAVATRVDAFNASFIQPYLDATAPGTAALGQRCLYAEQCATGVCLTASDAPEITYCSASCQRATDCGAGMACEDGLCRFPLPTPGAVGATCTESVDCVRGECLADRHTCSRRCDPTATNECPGDSVCSHLGGIDFYCTSPVPDPSGCTIVADPSSPSGLAILAIVLAARKRRRCRRVC